MGQNAINRIRSLREWFLLQQTHPFWTLQAVQFCSEEIFVCFERVLTERMSTFESVRTLFPQFRRIAYYFERSQLESYEIEGMIAANRQLIIESAIRVLDNYGEHLSKILPTNVSYFHFMREQDLYEHYVIMKYAFYAGFCRVRMTISQNHFASQGSELKSKEGSNKSIGQGPSSIFSRISSMERFRLFPLLLDWLSTLISYRCSAFYIHSPTVDGLIGLLHAFCCGLLGRADKHPLKTYQQAEANRLFNTFLLVSCYQISISFPQWRNDPSTQNKPSHINQQSTGAVFLIPSHHNAYSLHSLQLSVASIVKTLLQCNAVPPDQYVPTYFFVDILGFLDEPYTHKILAGFAVACLFEINQHLENSTWDYKHAQDVPYAETQAYYQKANLQKLKTELWLLLELLINGYNNVSNNVLVGLLHECASNVDSRDSAYASIIRLLQSVPREQLTQPLQNMLEQCLAEKQGKNKLVFSREVKKSWYCKRYLTRIRSLCVGRETTNDSNLTHIGTLQSYSESPEESVVKANSVKGGIITKNNLVKKIDRLPSIQNIQVIEGQIQKASNCEDAPTPQYPRSPRPEQSSIRLSPLIEHNKSLKQFQEQ